MEHRALYRAQWGKTITEKRMCVKQNSELLQSPLWGKTQEADGRKIFYAGQCLIIKHALPFGKSWLYSPRPEIKTEEQFTEIAGEIAKIARTEKAIFWKMEGIQNNFQIFNFQFSKGQPLQYAETFIIDLSKTEEDLLKNMKSKTRYNIGLAQKKGMITRLSKDESDVDIFYRLLTETAERQKIGIHSEEHYRNIIKILGEENAAAIIFAYHNNQPIAANLITFFGDTAVYLHGGADHQYRSIMAPYLLQWEAIREARERGCHYYDFGGCAVTRGKINEWAGITRFKEGFGGELFDFGETYDVAFRRARYWLYKNTVKFKALIT